MSTVIRFPAERRLKSFRERLFDGNSRYQVKASMESADLDAMAERIVLECSQVVDVTLYAMVRVGVGKSRDRILAEELGIVLDEEQMDFGDDDLVRIEADLYELRKVVG